MNSITKKCTKCGETKHVSDFVKRKDAKIGTSSWCKQCIRKKSQLYRELNPEKDRLAKKKWKIENKEKIKESSKIYRAKNVDKRREYNIKWKQEHPGKKLEIDRSYRSRNLDKFRFYQHIRRAALFLVGGTVSENEWSSLKKFYDYTCLKCRRKEPEIKLTIDHVIPLSLGGKNVIGNIQPLCKSCNSSKGTKVKDYR